MNLERYPYTVSKTFLDFEFESAGPQGKIKKIVRYTFQNANGITYCNLGFGDLNPVTGKIDDLVISNNKDRSKILATVAATVLLFTEQFPDMMIYAEGSTPVRTRLYQIGIMMNWEEIKPVLDIYGYSKGKWGKFKRTVNYEAFIVLRKKTKLQHKRAKNDI
jgi:hypothetical protein